MPHTSPPLLTDRAALTLRRARMAGTDAGALFLHAQAAGQIKERLEEVNRRFTTPAIVTGHPHFWAGHFPDARCVADTDVLDLSPGQHDLVIHAMALHWANDPVGQLVQMRRALKPDGLCLCVFAGGQTLTELRRALADAESALSGGLSPRIAPMGDVRDMGGLLQRAGFALPVADLDPLTVTYDGALSLMKDLRAMGETNVLNQRDRRFAPRELFRRTHDIYAARFPADDGRIVATFDMIYLTGWAPHASQPQPLKPGSAKTRLADALGLPGDPVAMGDDAAPEGGRD